jgi:hypothetical protein
MKPSVVFVRWGTFKLLSIDEEQFWKMEERDSEV